MTVTAIALVIIAICQVVWLVGTLYAVTRIRALAKRGEPLIASVTRVADNVKNITQHFEETLAAERELRGRVVATAGRVLDQVEPPLRNFAAVIAGVRAGARKLFEHRSGNHNSVRAAGSTWKE